MSEGKSEEEEAEEDIKIPREAVDIQVESKVSSKVESEVESKVSTKVESEVESKVSSKVESGVESKVSTKAETQVDNTFDNQDEIDNQDQVGTSREGFTEGEYKEEIYRPKCNARLAELSKPKKLYVRDVLRTFEDVLSKRNKEALRQFLQEEFAKTAEETQGSFKKINRKVKEKKCRKKCRKTARKEEMNRVKEKKRQEMLKKLKNLLKKQLLKVYHNPVQIIMTDRFSKLSNIILSQLCEVRDVEIPNRESTSIRSTLLFAASDFFAYCMNTLFYELDVKKVQDYEELKAQKAKEETKKEA